MRKSLSNAKYVMNMVILQIDVQKIEKMKMKRIEDPENKWEQVKRNKIANKQPAHPASQPSHSVEALTNSPKVTLESQNPLTLCSHQTPPPLEPPDLDLDLEPRALLLSGPPFPQRLILL